MTLLTTSEAAERLGVTRARICQLVKRGELAGEKVGRDWVIRPEDVDKFRRQPIGRKPANKGREHG